MVDKEIDKQKSKVPEAEEGHALAEQNTLRPDNPKMNHGGKTYTAEQLKTYLNQIIVDINQNKND